MDRDDFAGILAGHARRDPPAHEPHRPHPEPPALGELFDMVVILRGLNRLEERIVALTKEQQASFDALNQAIADVGTAVAGLKTDFDAYLAGAGTAPNQVAQLQQALKDAVAQDKIDAATAADLQQQVADLQTQVVAATGNAAAIRDSVAGLDQAVKAAGAAPAPADGAAPSDGPAPAAG